MSKLIRRTHPLDVADIEGFFAPPTDHLKYRLTMLLSWKERTEKNEKVPLQDAICGFEAALVACRVFIQFFGLKTEQKPHLKLIESRSYFNSGDKTDEVKITDLGGVFVYIAKDLTIKEAELLARTYQGASKAASHLTFGSRHGFDPAELPQAIDLIIRLLKSHLYDRVQRPLERHYD